MNIKKPRYKKVSYKGIKGIRKDLKAKTYYVEKYIRGKRFSATFNSLTEAADWKKNFHPSLSLSPLKKLKVNSENKELIGKLEKKKSLNGVLKTNGNEFGYTFGDIWELYKTKHLSRLEKSTFDRKVNAARFYDQMMEVKMTEINSDFISRYLEIKTQQSQSFVKNRRYNCHNDLKNLKSNLQLVP